MQFDHIGLVTATLAEGRAALNAMIAIPRWTEEFADSINHVSIQFGLDSSGICYELIAPLGENSPIAKAAHTGKNVLNHIAYLVADLDQGREQMRASGGVPTAEPKPAIAYGGNRIQFFMTAMHFIVELIEAPKHQHRYNTTYW